MYRRERLMLRNKRSQSIDQEMSTKSRITLSNCNALLILSEISAKLDRLDPLTIRRWPFSCITFPPNKWWISHKRRPIKFLQKHFFFSNEKCWIHFLSNQMTNIFYPAGLVANWSTSWSDFALKMPMILPSNGILSMITWISATAMAIPISQYNGYSSIDWQIEYTHSTITFRMKANDLILFADGACNPETPLIRIMPLFKLVLLELSILWLLRTTIEDWIEFELWPLYLNINSFFLAPSMNFSVVIFFFSRSERVFPHQILSNG